MVNLPLTVLVAVVMLSGCSQSHILVPPNGTALHCGGQSPEAFANYSAFLGSAAPAVYMTYVSLGGLQASYFASLKTELDMQGGEDAYLIPQIGLQLPPGDLLANVAKGGYAANIAALVAGLKLLDRPAYIRVGYEFNGGWNNYPATDYVTAFETVVSAWRAEPSLATTVAAVWDGTCDAGPARNWMEFYPNGTIQPDWAGINIFSRNSLASSACVAAFVDMSKALMLPIMLGESTPRTYGTQDKPWSMFSIAAGNGAAAAVVSEAGGGSSGVDGDAATGLCIGVSNASQDDGAPLVLWSCGPGPNQLWRFTDPEGFLVNDDGKCVGAAASAPSVPITTECSATHRGPTAGRWRVTPNGMIVGTGTGTGGTQCLVAANATRGAPVQIRFGQACSDSARDHLQRWVEIPTQVGGGNATWSEWFMPYIALINDPAVRAFCYINWFWPAQSNQQSFNWYNWGDDRIEHTVIVGNNWKAALSSESWSLNAQPTKAALCAKLGC